MPDLDDTELEPTKSSKMPLIAGVAVAFLMGGGAGFAGAGFASGEDDAEAAEQAEEAPKDVARAVLNLETFTVNLRGAGGGRMLRVEVQLEVEEPALEQLEQRKAQLRDAVLTLCSDYTYSDLEGLDGKTRLRDELLARLNVLLDGPKVERVYFTQFVVQ